MQFKEYEQKINDFAIYPEAGRGTTLALAYTALGAVGEAGEYAEKIKKYIREGKLDKPLAAKELGDALWYITRSANELGYTLQDIAEINLVKLTDRKDRGVINGEGDVR